MDVDEFEVAGADPADEVHPIEGPDGSGDRLNLGVEGRTNEARMEERNLVAARAQAGPDFGGNGGDVVDLSDAHGRSRQDPAHLLVRAGLSHSRV